SVFCRVVDPRALLSFPTRRSSDLGWRRFALLGLLLGLCALVRVQDLALGIVVAVELCLRAFGRVPHGQLSGGGAKARRHSSTARSEEHTSELQSRENLVCRLLLEK